MMKTKLFCKSTALALLMVVGLLGCQEKRKEFDPPPWLGGTSIETLKGKGNYTQFLRLMDLAGYTEPIKKQLYTLFAPDDAAFKKYFETADSLYGRTIDSVGELSKEEALELFTLHMISEPRNTYYLMYENKWGELQTTTTEYNTLFFRKFTSSQPLRYNEVPKYDKTYKGQQCYMKPTLRQVPLFSKNFFQDYFGAPDGSDYSFMYPNSTWGGLMQWNNARIMPDPSDPTSLEKLATRTATGFIYYLDQVCEPAPNIDHYISKQPQYSLFYDLLQRFAKYTPGVDPRDKKKVFTKSYNGLENLWTEAGPTPGNESGMLNMFTLFAPSNDILTAYLNKTFLTSYPNIDSIPMVSLSYVIQSQIAKNLALKSKILKSYYNYYGDKITITADDLRSARMCDNGLVYDMNRVLEPNVFSCVPGTLFYNSKYATFLYLLYATNMIVPLSNPNQPVTLFAATNEEMAKFNIRYALKDNVSSIQLLGTDKAWHDVTKIDDLIAIAKDHIYFGTLDDFSGDKFIEMSSGSFIHVSNNLIYGGGNELLGKGCSIVEKIVNDKNGLFYNISSPIIANNTIGQFIYSDPDLSEFRNLMAYVNPKDKKKAVGLLDTVAKDANTKDIIRVAKLAKEVTTWTGFIPTNEAIIQGRLDGTVPPIDSIALVQKFVQSHFVRNKTIFDDGNISGKVATSITEIDQYGNQVYTAVTIVNDKNNLKVIDHSGQEIIVDHAKANNLVRNGVIHKITTVFKY